MTRASTLPQAAACASSERRWSCRVAVIINAAQPSARELSDAHLRPRIEAIFRQHQCRYGYRRTDHLLRQEGITLSPDHLIRLMREAGLIALQPKT